MPEFPVGNLGVLVSVDDEHLGIAFHVRRGGVNVQVAEAASEGDLLLRRHRFLVAEEDHGMTQKSLVNFTPLLRRQRTGQVRPANLRADHRSGRRHLDGLVIHSLGVPQYDIASFRLSDCVSDEPRA